MTRPHRRKQRYKHSGSKLSDSAYRREIRQTGKVEKYTNCQAFEDMGLEFHTLGCSCYSMSEEKYCSNSLSMVGFFAPNGTSCPRFQHPEERMNECGATSLV